MCSIDGIENPCFYAVKFIKRARKTHSCEECQCNVEPRSSYVRVSGKWEGYISTFTFCRSCWDWGMVADVFCGGWMFGCLDEELNHINDYSDQDRRAVFEKNEDRIIARLKDRVA